MASVVTPSCLFLKHRMGVTVLPLATAAPLAPPPPPAPAPLLSEVQVQQVNAVLVLHINMISSCGATSASAMLGVNED